MVIQSDFNNDVTVLLIHKSSQQISKRQDLIG